jgi:GST-like protein
VLKEVNAMITLYYNPRPNPIKVALYLEEAELEYQLAPVDLLRGEHLKEEFRALNPNSKVPVLVDGESVVFDSTAILLYLVDKTGKFGPSKNSAERAQFLSWLTFISSGIGPFSGQAVHFRHYAPKPQAYALNRYDYEADRHWRIVDERLGRCRYLLGDAYSAVDMALWGWAPAIPYILGDGSWARFPNVSRWLEEVDSRPAAQRVKALETKFSFKTVIDAESLGIMFPQNARLVERTPST